MKKIIIIIGITLITLTSKAQEFSYGVLLGGDLYLSANNNSRNRFENGEGSLTINYGGYAEYNFNKNIGIKTELSFHNKSLNYNYYIQNLGYFSLRNNHKFSFFEIAPSLKFDFGQEYRKGFYMLLGPKFSTMTSATYEGEDVIESFNKSRTGLQLGFGTRIKRIVDFETKLDYEFTPFFETIDDRKSNFFSIYFTLGLDLERLIKNK